MTVVDFPRETITQKNWVFDLRESVGDTGSDARQHETWLSSPFRVGMPIIVVPAPQGVEERRSDLIGMPGELIRVVAKGQGERACTFQMHNGEIVSGKQIWWTRR